MTYGNATATPSIAGHVGRPETVRDAVTLALRDFSLAYKRSAEESLASRDVYERSLGGFLPESIVLGAQKAIDAERFCPAPATLRKYVVEEHERLTRSRDAVVRRADDGNGMACPVCGAQAYWRNQRWVMDHLAHAHGVYRGGAA